MIPHCNDKHETKRKRGRPSKTQKKADYGMSRDPKAYFKQRLSVLMDDMFYIYEGSKEDTKPILSRANDDCNDIDEEKFNKQNTELRILLEEYLAQEDENRHQKSCDSSKPMVLQEYDRTGKLPLIETYQSDDEEEICQPNPVKTSRTSYLTIKEPIKQFCTGSLEKLPQEKQEILIENQDSIFNAPTYQEQIETVIKLIYSKDRKDKCGPTAIGRLFGVSGGTIAEHQKRMSGKRRELIGRPALLDEEQLQIVDLFIQQQNTKHDAPTVNQINDFVFCSFAISLKPNTLHKILQKSSVKPVIGIPLENTRAEVPLEVIQSHYSRLQEILEYEKVPPAFVLNVDESGFQEFSDASKQTVYVPKSYEYNETYVSVNRSAKRNTMIGCIGMDGTALIPLIVTPYKTVERSLLLQGYGPDKCVLVQQDAGFVTSQIFAFWADHVLFPYVLQKRMAYGYEGIVILFLDGCSAHFSDYFMDECTYYGIYPIKEPPGTSDQIQQLDLGIFGIQKALQTKHYKGDCRANDKAIIEIVNSWRKATTPDNVVSAFHQSGLYVNSTSECDGYVCADISKARAVRGIEHKPCHDVITGRQSVQIFSLN